MGFPGSEGSAWRPGQGPLQAAVMAPAEQHAVRPGVGTLGTVGTVGSEAEQRSESSPRAGSDRNAGRHAPGPAAWDGQVAVWGTAAGRPAARRLRSLAARPVWLRPLGRQALPPPASRPGPPRGRTSPCGGEIMRSIRGAVTARRQLPAHSNQRGAGAGLQLPACGRHPARTGAQARGRQPGGGLRPPCILCPGAPLAALSAQAGEGACTCALVRG